MNDEFITVLVFERLE